MDDYYLKYKKYKTKYLNLHGIQSGGVWFSKSKSTPPRVLTQKEADAQTQAKIVADEREREYLPENVNTKKYSDLQKKYLVLTYKLKYMYCKIKSSKYYIINSSYITEINLYINEYIQKIQEEYLKLQNLKYKDKFDDALNISYDRFVDKIKALFEVLDMLDKYIKDIIITQKDADAKPVKEGYDNLYKMYAKMSTELYTTLKDNPHVKKQDEYFNELLTLVKI